MPWKFMLLLLRISYIIFLHFCNVFNHFVTLNHFYTSEVIKISSTFDSMWNWMKILKLNFWMKIFTRIVEMIFLFQWPRCTKLVYNFYSFEKRRVFFLFEISNFPLCLGLRCKCMILEIIGQTNTNMHKSMIMK